MAERHITLPEVTVSHRNFSITVPSIDLEPGEILGIFGKSGAGKTSYMKRLREHFDSPKAYFMSQFDSLLEEITVKQNVELGLAYSGKDASYFSNWEKNYHHLLHEFEVDRFLPKYPKQLSGGQRKRTEIVRCLMMDPEVLLLDEPFQGIGHIFESVATAHILDRARTSQGVTIIVSHDFDLLCKFSKRVMLVDDEGVIGFVPTQQAGWKPSDVRTAWTLGVENVLPVTTVKELLPTQEHAGDYISFWAWVGQWQTTSLMQDSSNLIFTLKDKDMVKRRTYLLHGTLYTEVHVRVPSQEHPVVLVGKGEIEEGKDIQLVVKDVARLENNSRMERQHQMGG